MRDTEGGRQLRAWISATKFGQAKLARATGKSRWSVWRWAVGGAVPDAPTAAVLARECGIAPGAWGRSAARQGGVR